MTEMLELHTFVNSNEKISAILTEAQGHDFNKSNRKKLNEIGIDSLPVYLLVDSNGIELKTPYLSEIKEYIEDELNIVD